MDEAVDQCPIRIAILTDVDPHGSESGGSTRLGLIQRALSDHGTVELVVIPPKVRSERLLNRLLIAMYYMFIGGRWQRLDALASPKIDKQVKEQLAEVLAKTPDLIWVFKASTFRRIASLPMRRVILDLDVLPHLLSRLVSQHSGGFDKISSWISSFSFARYTRRIENRVEVSVLSNPVEAQRSRRPNRFVVRNGTEVSQSSSTDFSSSLPWIGDNADFCFVGNLHFKGNAHGLQWFVNEVGPLLIAEGWTGQLLVAGSGGDRLRIALPSWVRLVGFVEDISTVYRSSIASIAPIWIGSGTRIKIIEAAVNGVPVVATEFAAEGLEFVPHREILISNSPHRFAQLLLRLVEDPLFRANLADSAMSAATERHGIESVREDLSVVIDYFNRNGSLTLS
jgi:glycosyltransferase involved in cell wall biosynthesis